MTNKAEKERIKEDEAQANRDNQDQIDADEAAAKADAATESEGEKPELEKGSEGEQTSKEDAPIEEKQSPDACKHSNRKPNGHFNANSGTYQDFCHDCNSVLPKEEEQKA